MTGESVGAARTFPRLMARERAVLMEQAGTSQPGKAAGVLEKVVAGRLVKYWQVREQSTEAGGGSGALIAPSGCARCCRGTRC